MQSKKGICFSKCSEGGLGDRGGGKPGRPQVHMYVKFSDEII